MTPRIAEGIQGFAVAKGGERTFEELGLESPKTGQKVIVSTFAEAIGDSAPCYHKHDRGDGHLACLALETIAELREQNRELKSQAKLLESRVDLLLDLNVYLKGKLKDSGGDE